MIHWLLLVYMLLICLASFAGGIAPLRLTHATTQFAVSFVAGVMLGVAFLHMIPDSIQWFGQPDSSIAMLSVLAGFLLMFFIQRYLAVHQHVAPQGQTATEHQCGVSDEIHHHAHEDLAALSQHPSSQRMSSIGAALGLSLHSMINGVALAAAFEAQWNVVWLAGGATFLAIFVHKPFDSLTIATLMKAEGWSNKARNIVNVLFALAIPVGVTLFYLGLRQMGFHQRTVLGGALGVSAGVFVCIAASDLLPEMHFHAHDRGKLSFWLLAGIGLAYVVGAIGHH